MAPFPGQTIYRCRWLVVAGWLAAAGSLVAFVVFTGRGR